MIGWLYTLPDAGSYTAPDILVLVVKRLLKLESQILYLQLCWGMFAISPAYSGPQQHHLSVYTLSSVRWRYKSLHDKTNKMTVRPAKTQISLGIRPAWSESSLCAQWAAKDPSFLHADSEDSDQTGRMPKLVWAFAGRTLNLSVL